MRFLTENAVLICSHELGVVLNRPSQDWVTIGGRRVLTDDDPESRPIRGCPNLGATIKPCMATLKVQSGYSEFIRIDGRRACLEAIAGLTDGTPPGTVKYSVRSAGQDFVSEAG